MNRHKGTLSLIIGFSLVSAFIFATLILYAVPETHWLKTTVFAPFLLLPLLTSIFLVLTSYTVAFLIMKSYLLSGAPILLYFGAGMLTFGTGSLVSSWFMAPYGPNVSITIFNVTVLVTAMFHMAGIIMRLLERRAEPDLSRRRLGLATCWGSVLVFVALLSLAAVLGLTSVFYIPGTGPTLIRQAVLMATLLLLVLSFACMMVFHFEKKIRTLCWYALALGFLLVGIGSTYLDNSVGTILEWLGRLSQYLAGVYFVVASVSALNTARKNGMFLTETLSEAFQRSEQRVSRIYSKMTDAYLEIDDQWRFTFINNRAMEYFQLTGDVTGMSLLDVHLRKTGSIVVDNFTKAMVQKTSVHFELESVRYPGRWFELHAYPLNQGLCVYFNEITERKKTEEALRESENKFKDLVEKSNAGVYLIQNHVHKYVNFRFAQIHGYDDPGDMIDHVGPEVTTHPDDLHASQESIHLRQDGVRSQYRQFRIVRKDGEIRDVEVYGSPTTYHGRPAIIGTMLDITDRKLAEEKLRKSRDELEIRVRKRTEELSRAYEELQQEMQKREETEEKLRQSHKMEALGTLAGGIAHDFNNILGGLIGFAEIALEDTEGQAKVQKSLTRVLQSAARAKDLVRQILAFSRKKDYPRSPVSVTPVVKETIKLLRSSIPATIDITFSATAQTDTILATPTELQQIIMNLATNASLAMQEKGGAIEISLSDTFHPHVADSESPPKEYLQLTVKDTGVGMTREVMERAFDPFFTTREPGKGTGMGLAVVYGTVRNMNGEITVSSEPGEGTTFTIILPKAQTGSTIESEKLSEVLGGTETILFVEDEEMLNEWGKTVLESLGYTVHAFRDPKDALQKFSKDPMTFDMVITDYAMPNMAGSELATHIRTLRKDIPIVLRTGYQDPTSFVNSEEIGITEILSKPLRKRDFAAAVRRVLDQQEPIQ